MTHPDSSARNAPFLPVFLTILAMGLFGVAMVMPYVLALERQVIAEAARRTHLAQWQVLAISGLQSVVMFTVATAVGLGCARVLGLGAPLISWLVARAPKPKALTATMAVAVAVGLALGGVVLALDHYVFALDPVVAEVIRKSAPAADGPSPLDGFLGSFYGGFGEEILMRLFLVSTLALIFRQVMRIFGVGRGSALPGAAFWTANLLAAVIFGLGHLPATAALAPITPMIVARAVSLNGILGVAYGVLYRRYGLEWAMAAHFATDLILHVLTF